MGQHSFLIMAYGESPYLKLCIESLLSQSVKSGIAVCTGTPNRHIEELAADYGLPLHINGEHRSIAGDWNFAAAQADTEFYTLAHQDDIYYKDYVKTLLPKMGGALIGFSDYEELTGEGLRRHTPMLAVKRLLLSPYLFRSRLATPARKKSILRFGNSICCPSVMYNRGLLRDFRFGEEYRNNLDWDAWLRMAEMPGAFVYAPSVLMAHRIHADSETTRQIASSGRTLEDEQMMYRLWSPKAAKMISRLYSYGQKSNSI